MRGVLRDWDATLGEERIQSLEKVQKVIGQVLHRAVSLGHAPEHRANFNFRWPPTAFPQLTSPLSPLFPAYVEFFYLLSLVLDSTRPSMTHSFHGTMQQS